MVCAQKATGARSAISAVLVLISLVSAAPRAKPRRAAHVPKHNSGTTSATTTSW
jgi:hypothetical protein